MGGIASYPSSDAVIRYCYSDINIETLGMNCGGIIAGVGGKVEYCYNLGQLTSKGQVGGISAGSDVINSYNCGKIEGEKNGVGGINAFNKVENSYNRRC